MVCTCSPSLARYLPATLPLSVPQTCSFPPCHRNFARAAPAAGMLSAPAALLFPWSLYLTQICSGLSQYFFFIVHHTVYYYNFVCVFSNTSVPEESSYFDDYPMPISIFQLVLGSEGKMVHSVILEMGTPKLGRKDYLPEVTWFVCLCVCLFLKVVLAVFP